MLTAIAIALAFVAGTLWEGCRRGGSVDLRDRLAMFEPRPAGTCTGETPIIVERSLDGLIVTARAQVWR